MEAEDDVTFDCQINGGLDEYGEEVESACPRVGDVLWSGRVKGKDNSDTGKRGVLSTKPSSSRH